MTEAISAYESARTIGAARLIDRAVVRASGADAQTFLQGQLSQDIDALVDGASTLSFILQPHGKVDALVRVTRIRQDDYIIDTDDGFGDALIERLHRFKMRTKVDFEPLKWDVLALRGPVAKTYEATGDEIVSDAHWSGIDSVDVMGEGLRLPEGVAELDSYGYQALRIESGMPAMGCELDEKTIPAEAGVNDRAINFRKGCYTGQELVARIDARGGNVPRHLSGVTFESEEAPPRGAKIMPSGRVAPSAKPLGSITSIVQRPGTNSWVALAYIRRDAIVPLDAVVVWDDVKVNAHVSKLPLSV